jgi:hypothetical protein
VVITQNDGISPVRPYGKRSLRTGHTNHCVAESLFRTASRQMVD